jgi:hypothetical protein
MIRTCDSCGTRFNDFGKSWKTLCLPCWKKGRAAMLEDLEAENAALLSENAVLRELLKLRPAPLGPDMLRLLTMLCHPDKHGGSQAATRATAYLLSLR